MYFIFKMKYYSTSGMFKYKNSKMIRRIVKLLLKFGEAGTETVLKHIVHINNKNKYCWLADC